MNVFQATRLLLLATLVCVFLASASFSKQSLADICSDAAGSSSSTIGFAGIPAEQAKTALKFETHFRTYGNQFMPQVDWRWFWAQGKQESLFDPYAKSRAGAMGIMQLMPSTLKEMEGRLGIRINPYNPRLSIMVGIAYDKRMYSQFKRSTVAERLPWMFASYNAGLGNVLRHQRACNGTRNYELVKSCLYDETRTYVERIRRYYAASNS